MFDVIIGGGRRCGAPCLLPQKSIVGSVVRGRRSRRRRRRRRSRRKTRRRRRKRRNRRRKRREVEGRPDCGIDPLGRCRGGRGGGGRRGLM